MIWLMLDEHHKGSIKVDYLKTLNFTVFDDPNDPVDIWQEIDELTFDFNGLNVGKTYKLAEYLGKRMPEKIIKIYLKKLYQDPINSRFT